MPPGVKRAWITPDGTVKTELTVVEMQGFRQKVMDAITPLIYEAVIRDHAGEMVQQGQEKQAG